MVPEYIEGLTTLVPITKGYRSYFIEVDKSGIVGDDSFVLCDEKGTPLKFTIRTRKDVENSKLNDELNKYFNCNDKVPSAITGKELTLIDPAIANKMVSDKANEADHDQIYKVFFNTKGEELTDTEYDKIIREIFTERFYNYLTTTILSKFSSVEYFKDLAKIIKKYLDGMEDIKKQNLSNDIKAITNGISTTDIDTSIKLNNTDSITSARYGKD